MATSGPKTVTVILVYRLLDYENTTTISLISEDYDGLTFAEESDVSFRCFLNP